MNLFDRQHRIHTLEAAAATLIAENDRLRIERAALQKENRTLRRRLPNPELRIMRRARLDAELLIAAHLGGLPTSRRESVNLGISHRRWNWAAALLDLARIRHRTGAWRTDEADQLRLRLDLAAHKVEREGIGLLVSHASKWGYSGRRRRA